MFSHAILLTCSVDLPAKSKICNCMQYNGYYGCCTCDCIGTAVGRKLCWPYEESSNHRTHASVLVCAKQAIQLNTPV